MTFVIGRENSSLGQSSFRLGKSIKNPNLLILLSNRDDISYQIRVLFFPDEIRVYKLPDS